jgi:hypothetical protein
MLELKSQINLFLLKKIKKIILLCKTTYIIKFKEFYNKHDLNPKINSIAPSTLTKFNTSFLTSSLDTRAFSKLWF